MAGKIAFSEKAIEQMNRGTQSHTLTGVKARWTWFLFGSVSLFFGAMIFWGFYGSMVESVSGVGITLLRGGVHPIVAGGSGTLSHLNIQAGADVSAEQIVGQIYNPEMLFNVRKLESEYKLLCSEIEFLKQGTERLTAQLLGMDREKKKHLEHLTVQQETGRKRAADIADIYSRLSNLGIVSKIAYYQTLDQMVQTENSLLSTLFLSMEADISQQDRIWQQEQKLLELKQRQEQKKQDLELGQKLYREAFWITPNFDGQVLEVFKEEGAYVQNGEKVALVASNQTEGMYLVAFVPPDQGKRIRNGMSAFFSPAAAPSAEYGYLKCVVREVSTMPVNAETVQAELMNTSLTRMVAGQYAVIRVVLEILPDSQSPSGYRWTSRKGYSRKIVNGMLGDVIINTSYRAPASYVIPALRELLSRKQPRKKYSEE
ncbi:MAG: NHLP bacteriocin system secretion protein [Lentisphaeria bacterium]|nr:NHLP bacteriocin system secretion protein [Lentisphaeria bacterium]